MPHGNMLLVVMEEINQSFLQDGMTPCQINDGSCEDWADEVMGKAQNVEIWETIFGYTDTTHVFIRSEGLFYDAECLTGVPDHMELPIFRRLADQGCNRQPAWCIDANCEVDPGDNKRDTTPELIAEYNRDNGTNNPVN